MPRVSGSDRRAVLLPAVLVLGSVEFTAAGLAVALSVGAPPLAVQSTFSAGRLVLFLLACALAASTLWAALVCTRRKMDIQDLHAAAPAWLRLWFNVGAVLGTAVAWIAGFSAPDAFGEWAAIFSRTRPLLIAGGAFACELAVATALAVNPRDLSSRLRSLVALAPSAFWMILLGLFGLWLAMLTSGFGIAKIGPFWNPPGVPLGGLQGIGIVLLIALGILLTTGDSSGRDRVQGKSYAWLVAIGLYVCALLIWGLIPMPGHYFSLRPARPTFQPFPASDARNYDLGALSILGGQGIYFHGYTDKPLYMVFLAMLHVIAADDYVLLTWLQLAVLAAIPVILYMLGKRYHSGTFGAAVAAMTILQQANAIAASREIDSVNPKLLMTEVPTMLGAVVVAYLMFRWVRTRRAQLAFAGGAAIGIASLVRVNPAFFLPVAGVLVAVELRARRPQVYRQLLLLLAGFALVFSPWIVTGTNAAGVPWLWIKLQYVIRSRYQSTLSPAIGNLGQSGGVSGEDRVNAAAEAGTLSTIGLSSADPRHRPVDAAVSSAMDQAPGADQGTASAPLVVRALSHSFHNAAVALLSLPDLVTMDNLERLSQQAPWGRTTWDGELTTSQQMSAIFNLAALSLGLAWSWGRFRLAGLVPALIFVGYDLSLAAATTSGGRYIVPVNWVAYFYYTLGWTLAIEALLRKRGVSTAESRSLIPAVGGTGVATWGTCIASVVVLASLVPCANVVVPRLVQPRIEEIARSQLSGAAAQSGPGVQLLYGKVLYPYYSAKNRSVTFDLLLDRYYLGPVTVARKDVFPYSAIESGALGLTGLPAGSSTGRAEFLYVAPEK
jgi:hypothetical protein